MTKITLIEILTMLKTKSINTEEKLISSTDQLKNLSKPIKFKKWTSKNLSDKKKESLMKCQQEIFLKLKKLNFLTSWTKSKREKFKYQKKMSQSIKMIKNLMRFKAIKMPLKNWDISGRLWLTNQLILTTKSNPSKKTFKILKIRSKKSMINLEIPTTQNFCKKLLNWNKKFMPFGMKLSNWKNNIKLKLLNMNKNKKKSNTSNGQRISKLKKLKLGKLKNNKERNKNLEKKKDKKRVIKNQSNKVRKNKGKKLKSKNQLLKERESIEIKKKLTHVRFWSNIVKTWVQVVRQKINQLLKSKSKLSKLWRKVNGRRWRMLKLFKAKRRNLKMNQNKKYPRKRRVRLHLNNLLTDFHTLTLSLKYSTQWRFCHQPKPKILRRSSTSWKTRWSTTLLTQTRK